MELEFVTHFYGTDLNPQLLKTQLTVLSTAFKERTAANSHVVLSEVIDFFKTRTPAQQELLSEVCKLLRLILVMPATNATSERSFSTLRRIKSFLRSTMTQQRMNHHYHLVLHRELRNKLDLVNTANAFASGNDHRHQIFDVFKSSDISR